MIKREHTQKACSQPAGSDNFLGHATQFVAHCLKCDLTKIKRFIARFCPFFSCWLIHVLVQMQNTHNYRRAPCFVVLDKSLTHRLDNWGFS